METQKLSNQLERKLFIDSEPRTLMKEELDKARAAAEAFISRDGKALKERRRRGAQAQKLVAANAKAAKTKSLLNQYEDIPSID